MVVWVATFRNWCCCCSKGKCVSSGWLVCFECNADLLMRIATCLTSLLLTWMSSNVLMQLVLFDHWSVLRGKERKWTYYWICIDIPFLLQLHYCCRARFVSLGLPFRLHLYLVWYAICIWCCYSSCFCPWWYQYLLGWSHQNRELAFPSRIIDFQDCWTNWWCCCWEAKKLQLSWYDQDLG